MKIPFAQISPTGLIISLNHHSKTLSNIVFLIILDSKSTVYNCLLCHSKMPFLILLKINSLCTDHYSNQEKLDQFEQQQYIPLTKEIRISLYKSIALCFNRKFCRLHIQWCKHTKQYQTGSFRRGDCPLNVSCSCRTL